MEKLKRGHWPRNERVLQVRKKDVKQIGVRKDEKGKGAGETKERPSQVRDGL